MENKGFTLIELLLVGVILGLFGTFVVMRFIGAQNASYDTRRMSDLKQYQIAFESFAANNDGQYPSRNTSGGESVDTLCTDLGLTVTHQAQPTSI